MNISFLSVDERHRTRCSRDLGRENIVPSSRLIFVRRTIPFSRRSVYRGRLPTSALTYGTIRKKLEV